MFRTRISRSNRLVFVVFRCLDHTTTADKSPIIGLRGTISVKTRQQRRLSLESRRFRRDSRSRVQDAHGVFSIMQGFHFHADIGMPWVFCGSHWLGTAWFSLALMAGVVSSLSLLFQARSAFL
jgi:hypothetical protein